MLLRCTAGKRGSSKWSPRSLMSPLRRCVVNDLLLHAPLRVSYYPEVREVRRSRCAEAETSCYTDAGQGLPWRSSGWDPAPSLLQPWLQSLVAEPQSCKPCGPAKEKTGNTGQSQVCLLPLLLPSAPSPLLRSADPLPLEEALSWGLGGGHVRNIRRSDLWSNGQHTPLSAPCKSVALFGL